MANENKGKFCPIDRGACMRDECMWWQSYQKVCSIQLMGTSLHFINYSMKKAKEGGGSQRGGSDFD